MAGGKHSSDEEFDWDLIPVKRILIIFCVLIIVAGASYGVYYGIKVYKEKQNTEEVVSIEDEIEEGMPKTIEGYAVLGELIIEKIGCQQYILDSTEDKALENGVSKLYGGDLNEIGNFCIAGHNFENIFEKLNELEIGDKFYILDTNEVRTEYEISGVYENEPEDLTCLLPNEEKAEITLITCQSGSLVRLVIKAEKIEEISEETETSENNEENTVENEE